MYKKGFTIVELIVVISLFALIGVAVTISFNHLVKKESYAINESYITEIKSAANYYATTNNNAINKLNKDDYLIITIKDLKDNGLLNEYTYGDNDIREDDQIRITKDVNGLLTIDYPI